MNPCGIVRFPVKRQSLYAGCPILFRVLCEKGGNFDSQLVTPNPLKSNRGSRRPTTNNQQPTTNNQQPTTVRIGVLALQGDFDAHRKRLQELGAEVVLVKKPQQLDEIDGLVIPGGESSTFLKLLGEAGFERLKEFVGAKPTFGTCAGAILLATEVDNPKQIGLGALDISIRSN